MSARVRIFVIEQDCGRLISLWLWLEQFAEVEVVGSCSQLHEMTQLQMQNTDILMIDLEKQDMQSIATLRGLKSLIQAPATLVLCKSESSAIEKAIASEADGIVKPNSPITELAESIIRTYNRRKIQTSAAKVPLTKAG